MGLDMYLTGDKYIPTDWENPENNLVEDGYRVKTKRLELGYWRKHPNLHGYIVENFAGGEDNCKPIELTEENIRQIIAAIKDRNLPHTTGFFFGESGMTDEEAKEDIEVFEKAIAWLNDKSDNTWRAVEYCASW